MHQKSGDVAERAYQLSRSYELTVITDQHWGQKRYDYDANGQIARTTHGDGKTEAFAYPPDLNISATGDTEKFQNWQTTAAGVVKLARGPNGEVVTLEHDACGRVTQRTVARNGFRPQTWRFGWNAQDQMVRADCPDGDVWTYKYDPFGRRISKACKHTKVTFIWDGDVIAREITETRERVDVVDWFFEPGSFRPMASHVIWEMACAELNDDLFEMRSGVAPNAIKEVHKETHLSVLLRNIAGTALTHAALSGTKLDDISTHMHALGHEMSEYVGKDVNKTRKQLAAAKAKYAFIRAPE